MVRRVALPLGLRCLPTANMARGNTVGFEQFFDFRFIPIKVAQNHHIHATSKCQRYRYLNKKGKEVSSYRVLTLLSLRGTKQSNPRHCEPCTQGEAIYTDNSGLFI